LIASFRPLQSLSISESPTEIKMFQIRGFTCGMWAIAILGPSSAPIFRHILSPASH